MGEALDGQARALPTTPGVARVVPSQAHPCEDRLSGAPRRGAAGLPPGSAWEKSKEQHEAEEDELYRRAYAETQPKKGATGR